MRFDYGDDENGARLVLARAVEHLAADGVSLDEAEVDASRAAWTKAHAAVRELLAATDRRASRQEWRAIRRTCSTLVEEIPSVALREQFKRRLEILVRINFDMRKIRERLDGER